MTMYVAGNNLRQIFFYLLGSFAQASWPQLAIALPLIVLGSAVMLSPGAVAQCAAARRANRRAPRPRRSSRADSSCWERRRW